MHAAQWARTSVPFETLQQKEEEERQIQLGPKG